MGTRVWVILNTGAGSAGNAERSTIQKALDDAGFDAEIHVVRPGERLSELARSAATNSASIVVAGGGDGTVSAVAAELIDTDKVIAVLPLGTLNHFSKDLGIPQDIKESISLLANGVVKEIDVGEVNGRYFINNSSIGLYPRMVRKRELQQERLGWGKWWAAMWAVWRFFLLSPFVKVKLDVDGHEMFRKTPFVFVGNNDYEMDFYNIGRRLKLDEGNLSIYLLHHNGRWGLFLLVLHTIFGRLKQNKDFEEFRATELTMHSRRRRTLVALDGEVRLMDYPLKYRVRPKALRVISPKQE